MYTILLSLALVFASPEPPRVVKWRGDFFAVQGGGRRLLTPEERAWVIAGARFEIEPDTPLQ